MSKKIIILATAVLIAASVGADAAPKKKIRVENKSNVELFYKVGGKVKKIVGGSSKTFSTGGRKKVKVKVSSSKTGGFRSVSTVNTENNKGVESNPFGVKQVTLIKN